MGHSIFDDTSEFDALDLYDEGVEHFHLGSHGPWKLMAGDLPLTKIATSINELKAQEVLEGPIIVLKDSLLQLQRTGPRRQDIPRAAAPVYRLPAQYLRAAASVRTRFNQLADRWEEDTAFTSATDEMVSHPAYLEIIGMGLQALPHIFHRLPRLPAPWLPALRAIAGEDVAVGCHTAEQAAQAWLAWGEANGYFAD